MSYKEACLHIDKAFAQANITRPVAYPHQPISFAPFRISPGPVQLSSAAAQQLQSMGSWLRLFYLAMDELYLLSKAGEAPSFIASWLDAGKPQTLLALAQADAFASQIPIIMRPDLLQTLEGWRATELDSIPGSMGLLAFLEQIYSNNWSLLGHASTAQAFAAALQHLAGAQQQIAIVISDECAPYRAETEWLSRKWQEMGVYIPVLTPAQLQVNQHEVRWEGLRLDVIYRFFELFDLPNVENGTQILRLGAEGKIIVTPPPKPHLEEKMWFAFLHHPQLQFYWENLLPKGVLQALQRLCPPTWLLTHDHVASAGGPLGSLPLLLETSRRQRPYILKPSGFSPLAWGGHGYSRGKNYTTHRWAQTIADLAAQAKTCPYILQTYQHSIPMVAHYYDFSSARMNHFQGKMRLCPYYFLQGENAVLSGALAAIVPLSKPVIHGMTEAVMVPAGIQDNS